MNSTHNKQVIAEIYRAMELGDRTAFAKACHPDYVWRLAGHSSWSKRFEGQNVIRRELIGPLFTLFATDYKAQVINLIAEGDSVMAEVRGDVMTKTGKRYFNEYCFIFKFQEGQIIEVVEYCDTDHLEKVLGSYEDALANYRHLQSHS
jgi:uncharacterized protein